MFSGFPSAIIGYFHGCVRGLTLNDKDLPFITSSPSNGIEAYNIALERGCQGDDLCALDTCPVNSICIDEWNQYKCTCLEGWLGDQCDVSSDDCVNHKCENRVSFLKFAYFYSFKPL